MTNPKKRKGDKAEREAAELLTEVTGFDCQRNLSAGIPGDVGVQRENAGVDFVASMVRFRGGQWRMVLTPEQFNTLLQRALQ